MQIQIFILLVFPIVISVNKLAPDSWTCLRRGFIYWYSTPADQKSVADNMSVSLLTSVSSLWKAGDLPVQTIGKLASQDLAVKMPISILLRRRIIAPSLSKIIFEFKNYFSLLSLALIVHEKLLFNISQNYRISVWYIESQVEIYRLAHPHAGVSFATNYWARRLAKEGAEKVSTPFTCSMREGLLSSFRCIWLSSNCEKFHHLQVIQITQTYRYSPSHHNPRVVHLHR